MTEALISRTPDEHLKKIAEAIATELEPTDSFKRFAQDNSDLLGAHAEAAVRRLIRCAVHPMRVSHGAVIDDKSTFPLRQLDAMLWMPFPSPAIFEIDDFALVPRSNVFGLIEIKRSGYRGKCEERTGEFGFEDFLNEAPALVADRRQGFDQQVHPGLGVICALYDTPTELLQTLMTQKKVVAIFDARNGPLKVSPPDVFILINFLQYVRSRFQLAMNTMCPYIPMDTPPDRRAAWLGTSKSD